VQQQSFYKCLFEHFSAQLFNDLSVKNVKETSKTGFETVQSFLYVARRLI